ncbi:hypothetical protein [Pedobacter gandavensis]|uniref:Uncharacterized protein n=1 Tax=Pedobacter gandavensis TaxID=2679963 RepID=A0ABR6EZ28_9SPHI|nr:hypothetical protein [Pedobacter gandavensis]MBB2150527.1 hypothetical protein [Pedobacter gandavensis]
MSESLDKKFGGLTSMVEITGKNMQTKIEHKYMGKLTQEERTLVENFIAAIPKPVKPKYNLGPDSEVKKERKILKL